MNLCFVSPKFPGIHNRSDYAFVKQLVDAIAKIGNDCYVVCPYNVFHYHKASPKIQHYSVGKGNVWVFSPWFYSFSNRSKLLRKLARKSHRRALQRAFDMLPTIPDAIYGHFWNSAHHGYEYAKKNNIPLFVATGESEISKLFNLPSDLEEFGKYVSGVICVSSKNRDESIKLGLTTAEKCAVFPNAVNVELFHERDREVCRQQLGLPQKEFIVSFVGWFIERKGPQRVAEAINRVGGVKSLFIGKGEQEPECDGILYKGAIPHDQVPFYLGASDCFVLPTKAEGCCNAVVEAMACGLPVISSNLPFNWDVLDETNSIMVDPDSIDEIAGAIKTLRDDVAVREKLAKGALKKAESLTIDQRAARIMDFIESVIKVNSSNQQ